MARTASAPGKLKMWLKAMYRHPTSRRKTDDGANQKQRSDKGSEQDDQNDGDDEQTSGMMALRSRRFSTRGSMCRRLRSVRRRARRPWNPAGLA